MCYSIEYFITKGKDMLIEQKKKINYKTITFRLDKELINEFRKLCKEADLKQVTIIENAMKKAILEIKELKEQNENKH
jgi:hypothetical protein